MLWSLLCIKPCSSDVLWEQGISSDQSRPGDIYHPDFFLGHPAYFDISVRSITRSAVVYSASSQTAATTAAAAAATTAATAAAAAAEVTKYQDIENGGDFIPLVYEIFVVNSRVKCRQDIC